MDYQELEVWKETKDLVKLVYSFTNKFPAAEQFGLILQIRRAAVSIPSNIAEGIGRIHTKETIQFIHIPRGSLYELQTQLLISNELFNFNGDDFNVILGKIKTCKRILNGFINY